MKTPFSITDLETRLAAAWPPADWQNSTVLLAISGGADSVALLRAMVALKTGRGPSRFSSDENGTVPFSPVVAAHLNHQLRGTDSEADEAMVVDLCRRLEIHCEVGRVGIDLTAGHRGQGLESLARRARYQFLRQTAERVGARYVVTAHTADDQAETILHRILRGTGIRGLAGMPRCRSLGPVTLLRPLLGIRRAELAAYLDSLGQPYRQDASNLDPRFTRNRIRHELLPLLAERFNPTVIDALLRLGSLAGEAQRVVDRSVEDLAAGAAEASSGDEISVDRRRLAGLPPFLVRELLAALWRKQAWPLADMGLRQWELLALMATTAEPEKQVLPGNIQAEVDGERFRLRR